MTASPSSPPISHGLYKEKTTILLGMNPAKEHVQARADISPPHAYVSDHGTAVESDLKRIAVADDQITVSADITRNERSLIEEAISVTQPSKKECFSNALKLWQYDHRFKYTEGYASFSDRPDIVVEHAWAMLDGDKIVDPIAEFKHHYGVVLASQELLEQNTGSNIHSEGIICGRRNYDFLRKCGYTK